ncbi:MAG: substrate-binding domain-containing protein [Verrucomicrobiae bacterium]|nr:substrate-binding domain-containing protein [Verrucomicrobiae bacterium]
MKKNPRSTGLLFKKKSLAEQIADQLRLAIRSGTWKYYLPPERALVKLVECSLPVLGQALHLLQAERLVKMTHGHPTRILVPRPGRAEVFRRKKVALLLSQPVQGFGTWIILIIDELRRIVYERGWNFEIIVDLRLHRKRIGPVLRTLVHQHEVDHWILASVPLAVQKWFHERKLAAVVAGHVFPGVAFPSVDHDLRAIARHAGGILFGLGHRRLVYLLRRQGAAGEVAMETGFNEALRSHPEAVVRIVRHSGDVTEIGVQLRKVFSVPQKPTAILISHPMDALTTMTWLLARGVRVPEEVSLISQFSQDFLERVLPAPARYEVDPIQYARYVCRLINQPSFKDGKIRLIPPFFRGATLADLRHRE